MNIRIVDDQLPPARPERRHFVSIADVTRDDVERLLGLAATFEQTLEREVKKLPALKGRLVVNLFYEPVDLIDIVSAESRLAASSKLDDVRVEDS